MICELNRALFLFFMTKPTEPRDDYYAQMKSSSSEESAPKPKILKIKTRRADDSAPNISSAVPVEQPIRVQREEKKAETPKASL